MGCPAAALAQPAPPIPSSDAKNAESAYGPSPGNPTPKDQIGFAESFPELHGYATLTYLDFGKDGSQAGNPTFDPYGLYLRVSSQLSKRLHLRSELEWEHADEVQMTMMELNYLIDPRLQITLGKFYLPLGLQRELYLPVNQAFSTALRPQIYTDLILAGRRDTGIQVWGQFDMLGLGYNAWLTNGLKGPTRKDRQNLDNNAAKAVGGRLEISPWAEHLALGVSYDWQKYDDQSSLDLDFLVLDGRLRLLDGRLDLLGEGVRSRTDQRLPEGGYFTRFRNGYYVQAAYKALVDWPFIHYLSPVVRFDTLDLEEGLDNNGDRDRLSFGLNYSPESHAVFKAMYALARERTGPELDNDAFSLEFSLEF